MSHNIVFIGASFGALPAAHALLRDVIPKLPADGKTTFKVTIVSSSTHFYWKVGSPRTIVNPSALPVEKALLPIEPEFKKYPKGQFEFIHAFATDIDASQRVVSLSNSSSVHYDSLVIASGTSFISPIWAVTEGSEATAAALKDIHARLPPAKSVLVAGGGAAGVETAGELGSLYGKSKEVTILSGGTQLLHRLQNPKIGQNAAKKLEGMGVKVVNKGLKVKSSKRENGKDVLEMSDGTTMVVDVYIEATGDRPNSKFVPKAWLNEKNFVKTDGKTLKLDVPGVEGVYCIGSVGSYSDGSILDTKFAQKALQESIRLHLLATRKLPNIQYPASPCPRRKNKHTFHPPFFCSKKQYSNISPKKVGKPSTTPRKVFYNKIKSDMQLVPVGPSGGVGVVMGYQAPSIMIWAAKSRDFMIGNALKTVNGTG